MHYNDLARAQKINDLRRKVSTVADSSSPIKRWHNTLCVHARACMHVTSAQMYACFAIPLELGLLGLEHTVELCKEGDAGIVRIHVQQKTF